VHFVLTCVHGAKLCAGMSWLISFGAVPSYTHILFDLELPYTKDKKKDAKLYHH